MGLQNPCSTPTPTPTPWSVAFVIKVKSEILTLQAPLSTKAYWAHGKKIFFRVITRIFRVITRIFRVITRIFRVITRIFRVITRIFRVITRIFRVITRMFRVITRIFRVITRMFRVITRIDLRNNAKFSICTLMLFNVFNDNKVQLGEVSVGLYIKLLKPPNTNLLVYVKDVASLDGHGTLAFKVYIGCYNILSLSARRQRSYRLIVKRNDTFSVHSFSILNYIKCTILDTWILEQKQLIANLLHAN